MKKVDLTSQFILYLAVTLVGIIGVMNFLYYHDHTNHLTESLESKTSAKLDFLESSASYYLSHFEYELITELGNKAMFTDRDMVYLSIEEADGQVLFEKGDIEQRDVQFFSREIVKDGQKIGFINLSLDIRPLMAHLRHTLVYTIGSMVLTVSLIGGMIFLFYRKKILREIHKVHREKELLRDEHEFIMTIINTASNLVMVLDRHGHIMLVNQACIDTLNSSEDRLIDCHISSLIDIDCGGEKMRSLLSSNPGEDFELFSDKLIQNQCISRLTVNDVEIHVEWKFSRLSDADRKTKLLVGTGIDITRQHQKLLEMSHRAHHDHLTSLPNRPLFNDRLQETLKQARRNPVLFAVLFIDLDHFKPINDKYGHEAGDLVLKIVSQRMQTAIRELDTVARLGGDEFGVLLLDVKNKENAYRIADILLKTISDQIAYGEEMLSVGASIGIAFYSNEVKDAMALMNQADTAMYQAKAAGGNIFHCFE